MPDKYQKCDKSVSNNTLLLALFFCKFIKKNYKRKYKIDPFFSGLNPHLEVILINMISKSQLVGIQADSFNENF